MEISVIGGFEPRGRIHARAHPIAGRLFSASRSTSDDTATDNDDCDPADEWYRLTQHAHAERAEEELYIIGSTVFWMRGSSLVMSVDMQEKFGTQIRVIHALFARLNNQEGAASADCMVDPKCNSSKVIKKSFMASGIDNICGLRWQDIPPPHPNPYLATEDSSEANNATTSAPANTHRALVVVMPETICIYFEGGRDYLIQTPFQVEWVYPLNTGLLIVPNLHTVPDSEPTLYTLHQVEDDVRSVALSTDDARFTEERQLYVNKTERVITTIENSSTFANNSLIITLDTNTCRLSMYSCAKLDLVNEEYFPVENNGSLSDADSSSRRQSIIYSRRSTFSRQTSSVASTPVTNSSLRRASSMRASTIELDAFDEIDDASSPSNSWRRSTMDMGSVKRKKTAEDLSFDISFDDSIDGDTLAKLELKCRKHIPNTSLTRIWNGSVEKGVGEVFLAHDIHKNEQLFIVQPESKILSILPLRNLKTISHLPAISAQPVLSTRIGLKDVLILQPEGSLALWTGRQLVPCSLPEDFQTLLPNFDAQLSLKRRRSSWTDVRLATDTLQASIKADEKRSILQRASRVVALSDSSGYNVNMALSNDQIFQTSLKFTLHTELVANCLSGLSYALPVPTFDIFRSRYLMYRFRTGRKTLLDQQGQEWDDLVVVFMSFCQAKPQLGTASDNSKRGNLFKSDPSIWETFLESSAHHMWSSDPMFKKAPPPSSRSANAESSRTASSSSRTRIQLLFEASKELYLAHHHEPAIFNHLSDVLNSLHLVYEDLKLSVLEVDAMARLGELLIHVARYLGAADHVDHYIRDGIPCDEPSFIPGTSSVEHKPTTPPSIYKWLILRMSQPTSPFPVIKSHDGLQFHHTPWHKRTCHRINRICSIYDTLFSPPLRPNTISEEAMVGKLVRLGVALADLDVLPYGIAVPIREALRRCRIEPPGHWHADALVLVGREDVAEQIRGVAVPSLYLQQCQAEHESVKDVRTITETVQPFRKPEEDDGCNVSDHPVTKLIFGNDGRLEEVATLLSSLKPLIIATDERPITETNSVVAAEKFLAEELARAVYARTVGRGIFAFATCQPQLQESFPIPPIRIQAIFSHSANVTKFEESHSPSVTDWPQFHNGVASALRISPQAEGIDGHWITYNKSPYNLDTMHAGFLLGMGLTGHLRKLEATQAYNYMRSKHEATSIALLLGLCTSYAGTGEEVATKLVQIHVPGVLPPQSTISVLNFSSPVITTSILALGYLYSGTMTRQYAEVFLAEIGRTDLSGDQPPAMAGAEGYALASGAALGLVTLGKGNVALGLSDMYILESLQRYIYGRASSKSDVKKHGVTLHTSMTPPPSTLDNHQLVDGLPTTPIASLIMSPPMNTDITAPGALIAMTLMYLKTNDVTVVSRITLPATRHMLDYVRPDHLILRILARSMILWDSVKPTNEWVEAQIPQLLSLPFKTNGGNSNRMDIDSGVNGVDDLIGSPMEDVNTVRQAYYCALTGACLSLGIRFAGTGNDEALMILIRHFDMLQAFVLKPATGYAEKLDRAVCRACIDTVAVSMSLIMAGTGDTRVLAQLKKLCRRFALDSYGDHMATNMALGFLFMGGGTMTLGTSNLAVASLILSVYPRWPTTKDDNRCHLQAFRHLWVLAAEPRCLVPMDVDTKVPVYLPILITLRDSSVQRNGYSKKEVKRVAPCLLPDFSHIQSISIDSPRYWKMSLNFDNADHLNSIRSRRVLVVKRKTGHLSYQEDPHGYRSILARPFPRMGTSMNGSEKKELYPGHHERDMISRQDVVSSLSSDPQLAAFVNTFCRVPRHIGGIGSKGIDAVSAGAYSFASFCTDVLHECLTQDKPEALDLYMHIFDTLNHLGCSENGNSRGLVRALVEFWSLKMVVEYYQRKNSSSRDMGKEYSDEGEGTDSVHMIRSTFLEQVAFYLAGHFDLMSRPLKTVSHDGSKLRPTFSIVFNNRQWIPLYREQVLQCLQDYIEEYLKPMPSYESSNFILEREKITWQVVNTWLIYQDVCPMSKLLPLVKDISEILASKTRIIRDGIFYGMGNSSDKDALSILLPLLSKYPQFPINVMKCVISSLL
ncbi:hypothetical protein SeMB42_g04443 [Synchytrium endobioticum]|uniref:Uncharacterized protein n=1 Tax=Synchytrium endobioticum TaxID=286115 RepID=A0A507CYC6_9FUNG|nr:hypothetical protein SeMB42_g04443 [Synchytrium endobioticum]